MKRAHAINALLIAPIDVLPAKEGDPVRPFRIGLGADIVARCRPEVEIATCEQAIGVYTRSFSYRLALARLGSMRCDLDGKPVEPVSEKDRQDAQRSCEVAHERGQQRKAVTPAAASGDAMGDPIEAAAPSGSQEPLSP